MHALGRYIKAQICLRRWLDLLGRSSLAAVLLVMLLTAIILVINGVNQLQFPDTSIILPVAYLIFLFLAVANVFCFSEDLDTNGLRRTRFYNFRSSDYFGLALLYGFVPSLTESACLIVLLSTPFSFQLIFLCSFVHIWLLSALLFLVYVNISYGRNWFSIAFIRTSCPIYFSGAIRFYLLRTLRLPSRLGWLLLVWVITIPLGALSAGFRLPHLFSYLLSPLLTGGLLEYLLRAEWGLSARHTWDFYAVTFATRDREKLRIIQGVLGAYMTATLVASLLAFRNGWLSIDTILALALVVAYEFFNAWALTRVLSSLARLKRRSLSDFQVALMLVLDLLPFLILLPMIVLKIQRKPWESYA